MLPLTLPLPPLLLLLLLLWLLLALLLLLLLLLLLAKVANNAVVVPNVVFKPNEYKSYFKGLLLLEDVSNNSVDMENN